MLVNRPGLNFPWARMNTSSRYLGVGSLTELLRLLCGSINRAVRALLWSFLATGKASFDPILFKMLKGNMFEG